MTITDYEQRLQRCMHSLVPDVPDALASAAEFAMEPPAERARFTQAPGARRRRWLAPLAAAGLVAAAATVTTVLVNLTANSHAVRSTIPPAQSSSKPGPAAAAVRCSADLFTPGRFRPGHTGGGTFDVVVRNTGPTCLLGRPQAVSIDATDRTYHLPMPFVPGSHPVPIKLGTGDRVTFRVTMQRIGVGPARPRQALLTFHLSAGMRRPTTVRVELGRIGMPSHEPLAPVNMTATN